MIGTSYMKSVRVNLKLIVYGYAKLQSIKFVYSFLYSMKSESS